MESPLITIIILNYNGKEIIKDCLDSLNNVNYSNYRIIVVDNYSKDGSQDFLKKHYPNVILIENNKNEGVAEGQNIGIREALKMGTDYIFVLNNDITVDKEILNYLLEVFNDNNLCIAVPIMYWPDESDKIQSAGGIINWTKGSCYHLNLDENEAKIPEIREIDYSGLIFTKAELFQNVGLFDSKLFAYWEDTDFCLRSIKKGYKILAVKNAKLWHYGSFTTQKMGGFKLYHMIRNRFWFMKKYSHRFNLLRFLLYFFLYEYWTIVGSLMFKNDLKSLKLFQKAIFDGLFGSLKN
jgi:GT2 family glycosyltransferase